MSNHAAESPKGFSWSIKLRLDGDVSVCRQRILDVVAIIIATPRHVWPNADQWRAMLPAWFIQQTPERTRAESQALIDMAPRDQWHTLSWEFKSWIQVVREREWSWWSCQQEGDQMMIHLSLSAWPANIDTFNHIVRTAGATIIQEGHTLDTDTIQPCIVRGSQVPFTAVMFEG